MGPQVDTPGWDSSRQLSLFPVLCYSPTPQSFYSPVAACVRCLPFHPTFILWGLCQTLLWNKLSFFLWAPSAPPFFPISISLSAPNTWKHFLTGTSWILEGIQVGDSHYPSCSPWILCSHPQPNSSLFTGTPPLYQPPTCRSIPRTTAHYFPKITREQ